MESILEKKKKKNFYVISMNDQWSLPVVSCMKWRNKKKMPYGGIPSE